MGIALLGLLILAAATLIALWQVSRSRCLVLVGAVTCRVETNAPLVALTFDDGPTPLGVERVLPVLARRDAHATFFLTGSEAAQRPELVRSIVAAGHEVGNHSFTHQRMVGRPMSFYEAEIERTQEALRQAGASSRTFRPPYGKKLIGLPLVVRRSGLRMVMWDIEDPATSDPATFAREVVDAARPGSIILIHAMYPANETARLALPDILVGLERKGLRVVPVEQLLESAP
jgi:peptidoglycan-N-acetylglucosamine deacetylase